MVVLTLDSFIRHMPHRAFVKLSCLLDPGGLWENMASGIPLKLEDINDEDAQRRFVVTTKLTSPVLCFGCLFIYLKHFLFAATWYGSDLDLLFLICSENCVSS